MNPKRVWLRRVFKLLSARERNVDMVNLIS